MKRILLIIPLLLVAACSRSPYQRVVDTCQAALEGLEWREHGDQCMNDLHRAEFQARQTAVQKYRNIPRI